MIRILKQEVQEPGVLLTVELEDGTVIAHGIYSGVLECRMVEWDLPTEEEALEAILVDGHLTPGEDFDAFSVDYEEHKQRFDKRRKELRSKIKWGSGGTVADGNGKRVKALVSAPEITPADVIATLALSPPAAAVQKAITRDEIKALRGRFHKTSYEQELLKRAHVREGVSAGERRRREEIQAEEFVRDLQEEVAPRKRIIPAKDSTGEIVELAIRFVE
jgi:hypothetical protein